MRYIQLQYQNETGANGGGLYLNVDQIISVYSVKVEGDFVCHILTTCGVVYKVLNDLVEVLEEIRTISSPN